MKSIIYVTDNITDYGFYKQITDLDLDHELKNENLRLQIDLHLQINLSFHVYIHDSCINIL